MNSIHSIALVLSLKEIKISPLYLANQTDAKRFFSSLDLILTRFTIDY